MTHQFSEPLTRSTVECVSTTIFWGKCTHTYMHVGLQQRRAVAAQLRPPELQQTANSNGQQIPHALLVGANVGRPRKGVRQNTEEVYTSAGYLPELRAFVRNTTGHYLCTKEWARSARRKKKKNSPPSLKKVFRTASQASRQQLGRYGRRERGSR
ncbi:hypothetical protein BX600DRAFT_96244 [Xylariales sp. PMI_506]|nr:hypothetical protein BX600DRAFT_96244 [Xylariales sp. PMI_506]